MLVEVIKEDIFESFQILKESVQCLTIKYNLALALSSRDRFLILTLVRLSFYNQSPINVVRYENWFWNVKKTYNHMICNQCCSDVSSFLVIARDFDCLSRAVHKHMYRSTCLFVYFKNIP